MSIIKQIICFLGILGLMADCSEAATICNLGESNEGGIIYKKCGKEVSKIRFDYKTFVVSLKDDDINAGRAILWQTPKESRMSDERYFILDYNNMLIYDNQCLGGNLILLDSEKGIMISKYEDELEGKMTAFDADNYAHCKKPLENWVKTQHP